MAIFFFFFAFALKYNFRARHINYFKLVFFVSSVYIIVYMTVMFLGDHFRQIFGPYAGWAHSVSKQHMLCDIVSFFLLDTVQC